MDNKCNNCGAQLVHRGAGEMLCPYCGSKIIDSAVSNLATNQAISSSVSLLARKAAKEELKDLEPTVEKVSAALELCEDIHAHLLSEKATNDKKRLAPWRIWGLLIGLGSFLPWWVILVNIFLDTPKDSSELAKTVVMFGAMLAAFLTGQVYRRLVIRKRKKVISSEASDLQLRLDANNTEWHQLKSQHKELNKQMAELREIAQVR